MIDIIVKAVGQDIAGHRMIIKQICKRSVLLTYNVSNGIETGPTKF